MIIYYQHICLAHCNLHCNFMFDSSMVLQIDIIALRTRNVIFKEVKDTQVGHAETSLLTVSCFPFYTSQSVTRRAKSRVWVF